MIDFIYNSAKSDIDSNYLLLDNHRVMDGANSLPDTVRNNRTFKRLESQGVIQVELAETNETVTTPKRVKVKSLIDDINE